MKAVVFEKRSRTYWLDAKSEFKLQFLDEDGESNRVGGFSFWGPVVPLAQVPVTQHHHLMAGNERLRQIATPTTIERPQRREERRRRGG